MFFSGIEISADSNLPMLAKRFHKFCAIFSLADILIHHVCIYQHAFCSRGKRSQIKFYLPTYLLNLTEHFLDQPCSEDPCLNEGSCTGAGKDFQCTCLPGYYGKTCEQKGIGYFNDVILFESWSYRSNPYIHYGFSNQLTIRPPVHTMQVRNSAGIK